MTLPGVTCREIKKQIPLKARDDISFKQTLLVLFCLPFFFLVLFLNINTKE
jgi:hypothetical protein